MPDSAMMIHLGKQEDEATVSPATVMPVGDMLLHGANRPYGPSSPRSRGAERWHRNVGGNYTSKSDQRTSLLWVCFAFSAPKAAGSLPSWLTSPQLPSSKIRADEGRCGAPLLTPYAECSMAKSSQCSPDHRNGAEAAQYRERWQDGGPQHSPAHRNAARRARLEEAQTSHPT